MTKQFIKILLIIALIPGCGTVQQTSFGVKDESAAASIDRVNSISSLRARNDFKAVETHLLDDLKRYQIDHYAKLRILNELADIYSFHILDIEKAIEFDEAILLMGDNDQKTAFGISHSVANNRILADKEYSANFIEIPSRKIRELCNDRLAKNRQLLAGEISKPKNKYDINFLYGFKTNIESDIKKTYPNTPDRYQLISRLIRAEYELYRVSNDKKHITTGYLYSLNSEIPIDRFDLSEIDYLSLSDYFRVAYETKGNPILAEISIAVLYKPYANLRNANSRWRYNKIINNTLNSIIGSAYEFRAFDELLYYASLNKSRMLLEERLAFASGQPGLAKVADLTINDGITRTSVGLPEKTWFKKLLSTSSAYLDFYVGGKYGPQPTGGAKLASTRDRSTMPLTTRDFGVEDATLQSDTFIDDVLYVTQVENGKVVRVTRLTGKQLADVKSGLNSSYSAVSDAARGGDSKPIDFFQSLKREANLPQVIKVSPDKWVAKHPLDFHLGTKVTRSVNFFTAGSNNKISTLKILGFFNPTLDLAGAEQEADAIRAQVPEAKIYKRETASIGALKKADSAPLLHLSMHGQFNSTDPKFSRLAFSGAIRGSGVTNDPNSLYAKDMYQYDTLKDRELIFAAACQTGLSAADQANENELMGILRPLTASRNKNIILSLWKVDDSATKDFVAAFYQRLAASKDITESFHFAQDQVRVKYKKPYYWAAFYLSQAR